MRALAIAALLALGAAPLVAGDAVADPMIRIQWEGLDGRDLPSTGLSPTPLPQTKPPGAAALERDRDTGSRWGKPRKRDRDGKPGRPHPRHDADRDFHHKRFKRDRRPFLFLDDDDDDDDDEERIVVVPVRPPEPEEPEGVAPPAPAPPDPRGPRFVPARGTAAEPVYNVGEPLPDRVAYVTLDWKQYGLPEPPPGLIYARVAGDVLLIDPATRRVERLVDLAALETAEGKPDRDAPVAE